MGISFVNGPSLEELMPKFLALGGADKAAFLVATMDALTEFEVLLRDCGVIHRYSTTFALLVDFFLFLTSYLILIESLAI